MADEDKTEQPTGRKLSKARSDGQVTKSIDLSAVILSLFGVVTLYFFSYFLYLNFLGIMRFGFTVTGFKDFTSSTCISLLYTYSAKAGLILSPIFSVLLVVALAVNISQVGFVISFKPLEPDFNKLNFVSGVKNLFSMKALVDLIKNFFKLIIIGGVVYLCVKGEMDTMLQLHGASVAYIFLYMLKVSFKIFIAVLLAMLVLAISDYAFQKWKFNKDMMMSRQEIKDENKQTEGDPLVKSRIKTLQVRAARKRMMKAVPEADVVVTNPTHLALALKYDPLKMNAPKVIAKGAGAIAEKIKEIARKHRVPVIENKGLAQNLYKLVEVGEEIPIELFKAVAELLAYVYKLKGKTVR